MHRLVLPTLYYETIIEIDNPWRGGMTIAFLPSQPTVFMRKVTIVASRSRDAEVPSSLLDALPSNHLFDFSCNTGLSADQFWRLCTTQKALKALDVSISMTDGIPDVNNSLVLDSCRSMVEPLKDLRELRLGCDDVYMDWEQTIGIAQLFLHCHNRIDCFYLRSHHDVTANDPSFLVWEANRAKRWFTKLFEHGLEAKNHYASRF
jgi:hypothetical protein